MVRTGSSSASARVSATVPRYIHERDWQRVQAPETPIPARRSDHLSARQQHWIRTADTLFIASGYTGEGESESHGMDASHRGGEALRSLRLVEEIPQSEGIASFVFTARDDGPLPSFEAGQHLPIEVEVPGHDQPQRRTYSLSSAPGEDRYRITVKLESQGLVSKHLHDAAEVGTIVAHRRASLSWPPAVARSYC